MSKVPRATNANSLVLSDSLAAVDPLPRPPELDYFLLFLHFLCASAATSSSVSCNCHTHTEKVGLWKKLAAVAGEVNCVLHLGDQIYGDSDFGTR